MTTKKTLAHRIQRLETKADRRPAYKAPKLSPVAVEIMEKINAYPAIKKLAKRIWMFRTRDPGYALARVMARGLMQDTNLRLGALIDTGFTEARARRALKGRSFQPNVAWLIDNPEWWTEYVDALIKAIIPLVQKARKEGG